MVAAFVTSAGLTLLVALLHLVLDRPWEKSARPNYIDTNIARLCGSISWIWTDVLRIGPCLSQIWNLVLSPMLSPLLSAVRWVFIWVTWSIFSAHKQKNSTGRSNKQWALILEKVLLSLSDQQLIAGFAMIIAALALHCSISVYHFTIVSDLVWFSSNVHLQSMVSLMYYMRKRPVERNWRVILMVCMAVMLATLQVFSAHKDWSNSWAYNFQCLLDDLVGHVGGQPAMWMGINLAFIVENYTATVACLFESEYGWATLWLFERPRKYLSRRWKATEQSRGQSKVYKFILMLPVATFFGLVIAIAVLLDSGCVALLENLFWFAYGLYWIICDRNSVSPEDFEEPEEGKWGFGQIIPLVMLSTILFTLGEAYYGNCFHFLEDITELMTGRGRKAS